MQLQISSSPLRPDAAHGAVLRCDDAFPLLYVGRGEGGAVCGWRSALCLETEYYPDSVHFPAFPQPVFSPGETYRAETIYRFSQ